MSALYAMRYLGASGTELGAIYIGRGKIVGIDVANARYSGSYSEQGNRMKAKVTLTAKENAVLVTGQQVSAGTKIEMTADWPSDFANGKPQWEVSRFRSHLRRLTTFPREAT